MKALVPRAIGVGRHLWRATIHPREPTGTPRGRIDSLKEGAQGGDYRYESLRPSETIKRSPPNSVGGTPPPVFERLRSHRHPEVFRAVFRNARIAGEDALVLTDDFRVLTESTFDLYQLNANPVGSSRLPRPRRLRGSHMLLVNPWCYAYFHWMLDTLPRAALLPLDELADVPVIVPGRLKPFQRETLELIGIDRARMFPFDHTHLLVDELHFPSFVGRTGNPPAFALEWLRAKLTPQRSSSARKLYVSRSGAASRSVANEQDVVAMLAERGFEVFNPSEMTIAEQFGLFREASVIVGPHGAGFVNTIASRHATVIELFEPGYVNGCYYALADALGHRYWYLVCETHGRSDIHVNLERLESTLVQAEA